MESFKDLSASAMNYSAPPLKTIVTDFDAGHSVRRLKRSAPIYFSSKDPHDPRDSDVIPLQVVKIFPPTAF